MTLSNMAAELGAQAGLIAPDETTADYIRAAGGEPGDLAAWQGDAEADYLEVHELHTIPSDWVFNAEGRWIGYRVGTAAAQDHVERP